VCAGNGLGWASVVHDLGMVCTGLRIAGYGLVWSGHGVRLPVAGPAMDWPLAGHGLSIGYICAGFEL
jgi:hypothetical protein